MTGHAILGGCGHLGSRIAADLRERGWDVVVIDKDPDVAAASRLEDLGCSIVRGDIRDEDVLEKAGITSAGCFIAATGDDRANLEAAITARQANERCAIVARLYDQTLGSRVESVLQLRALSASFLASPAFVSAATDDSVISAFTVDGCCLSVHAACARPPGASGHYVTHGEAGLTIRPEPGSDGDCFFAAVHHSNRQFYSKHPRRKHSRKRSPGLNPMGFLRELAATWKRAALISKRLLVALLGVMALSVVVFWGFGHLAPLDAAYFVVTTMTTVGYGDLNLLDAPAGLKVYGILMMLCGAALLATVYAIVADRVLASRLEYLLGRRRVNASGHTVVVGLGKVGYRVAVDLHGLGVEVVGIEAIEDSDNVNSARSLFPVVVGDASRASILSKAAVDAAETILALTDDPLLNLSVALSAREQSPAIRTIVRTYDVGLAEKFSSFGLDVALSTSAIAAPAFVDAAVHPGVQGSFRLGGEDVLVARHVVGPGSPLAGKTPAEIGEELGMAVIASAESAKAAYQPSDPNTPLRETQKALLLLTRAAVGKLS